MKNILNKIQTKSKSKKVLSLIDNVIDSNYKIDSKNNSISKLPFEIPKGNNTDDFLSKVKDSINNSEVITITLAIDISDDEEFVSELYEWFNKNGFKNFLLDIDKDVSIMGGLHFTYKGKFYDLSLVNKVNKYVQ